MHELSVCYALLDEVERIAMERGACRVSGIVIKMGPLCGVEPEFLLRAYPLAAAATIAAGARLVLEQVDIIVRCSECGAESSVSPNRLLCASCGDFRTNVICGDELILQRIELEDLVHASGLSADPDSTSATAPRDSR